MNHDASVLKGKSTIAYVRVSDEDSDPERQRETVRSWAEKYSITISMWFEDTAGRNSRHKSDKRQHFQEMVKVIEAGGIDAVLIDSIERLGFKDQHEFGYFIHHFRRHGVTVWSTVEGNLSAADPGSIFSNTAKTVGSSLEQAGIARRNLDKKAIDARKGLYQGGYPPFGFDVVCFEKGNEVWRVVYDGGHHRRVKVILDGSRQRYDGKGNFPAKDNGQELMVRPSIEFASRLDAVRSMFQWAATEGLSPGQIATRLNLQGIKPQVGVAWNKVVVKALLKNPVYVGFPTFNKRGQGDFVEWSDGAAKPLQTDGAAKRIRPRKTSDWIAPAVRQFESIVPQPLFDEVQKKLRAASEKHGKIRSPKVESFWLRNLLICSKCGQRMRAWNEKGWRSYFCSTYGTYGKHNHSGCRCHRVRADLIEKIVLDYLEETGKKVAVLQAAQNEIEVPKSVMDKFVQADRKYTKAWRRLRSTVASFLDEGEQLVVIGNNRIPVKKEDDRIILPEGFSPLDLFQHFTEEKRAGLMAEIARMEQEFEETFRKYNEMKSERAKNLANDEMVHLEAAIKDLQSQLEPLDQEVIVSGQESLRMLDAVDHCRRVMSGSNDRKKAEAVKAVINQIVCHFRYSDNTAANQPKSFLDKVEITPTVGDPWTYFPNGNMPARG